MHAVGEFRDLVAIKTRDGRRLAKSIDYPNIERRSSTITHQIRWNPSLPRARFVSIDYEHRGPLVAEPRALSRDPRLASSSPRDYDSAMKTCCALFGAHVQSEVDYPFNGCEVRRAG